MQIMENTRWFFMSLNRIYIAVTLIIFSFFSCDKKEGIDTGAKHYDSLSDYILDSDPDSVVFNFGMSAAPNRSGIFLR